MRILHLDTGRMMRGGQYQVVFLMRGLCERGVESTLLARGLLLERARSEGLVAEPLTAPRLLARQKEADLMHAHDARSHTLAAVAGVKSLVVSRRVAFPVKTGMLSRWKYSRPLRFIAISQFVRGRLLEAGIDSSRISVVYDGVPPLDPAPSTGRIVAPASDDPQKGNDILRATGLDIHYSSDLVRDLPGAAVFVYLSREEGLGSSVLLAMSAGVPVVASDVGGLPELIRHRRTGLLTANSPEAVSSAVRLILDDPRFAQQLVRRANEFYTDYGTLDTMVENTINVYRECLA